MHFMTISRILLVALLAGLPLAATQTADTNANTTTQEAAVLSPPQDPTLLISTLVYEEVNYVRGLVRNLVRLTIPSTNIIVHFSASSKVDPPPGTAWWAEGGLDKYTAGTSVTSDVSSHAFTSRDIARVSINPNRGPTHHARGSVLRQHLSNLEHARADLGLKPGYIMLHAAHSRLLVPGVEHYIAKHRWATMIRAPWLPVDVWDTCRNIKHMHNQYRDPAASYFCSLRPALDPPAECKKEGRVECNRLAVSAHEGLFAPSYAMYRFYDTLRTTKLGNYTRPPGPRNSSLGKPDDVLLDWLPTTHSGVGAAAEETWFQTYIWYSPKLKADYDASDVGPAVDKQFGPRRRSIGMCSVLAVLEFRDHSHCQFPLSIKRWSHDKVHMEFIECLGQKYRASGLVDAAWMDGSPEKWETARRLGESCFDAVKIWGQNTQRNILCAKDDMEKRQSLFQSIIVGNGAAKVATDPQGRNVVEYCMKGSQIKKELKNPRSPRDWSLMPER